MSITHLGGELVRACSRWLGGRVATRRGRVLVVLAAAGLLALRVALPGIVRQQLESQATANLTATLRVDDVDLWLLRGAIAVEGVELRREDAPADAAPFASIERLYANLGWLALLRGAIRLQTVEIDQPVVRLSRTHDGELELPSLRPVTPELEPEAVTEGEAWGFEIDKLYLRQGDVEVTDRVPEPELVRRVVIDGLSLLDFSTVAGEGRPPAQADLVSRYDGGTIAFAATIETEASGFGIDGKVDAGALPLDGLYLHAPVALGWSDLVGRLDASVRVQVPPGGAPTAQGTVGVRDLAVRVPGEAEPALRWERLEVEADQVDVAARAISLARIDLVGVALEAVRRRDGALLLPLLTGTSETPTEPGTEPAATDSASVPWDLYVTRATIEQSAVRFSDRAVEPEESMELELTGLTLQSFAIERSPNRGPGDVELAVRVGDGTLGIKSSLDLRDGAPSLEARLEAVNLPLDRLYLHAPELGWSGSRGRLDGDVVLTLKPGASLLARGKIAVRDLQVDVPDEPAPALAWRKLEVEARSIDLGARSAAIDRVALDGAGVVVRPRARVPLPLLPSLVQDLEAVAPASDATPADSSAPGGSGTEPVLAAPVAHPPARAAAAPPEPEGHPWSWSVSTIELTDSAVELLLEPPALRLVIPSFVARGASSDLSLPIAIEGAIEPGVGRVSVRGQVAPNPLVAKVDVESKGLGLGPIVDAVGGVPVGLPRGALDATFALEVSPSSIDVSGKLSIDDLEVVPRGDPRDFAAGWKRLDVELRRVSVPSSESGEPMRVELDGIRLASATLQLTRTEAGLAIPTGAQSPPAAAGHDPSPTPNPDATAASNPAAPATPSPDAPAAPRQGAPATPTAAGSAVPAGSPSARAVAPPVPEATPVPSAPPGPSPAGGPEPIVRVSRIDLDGAEITLIDRTVRPFFRGKISRIDAQLVSLRLPEAKLGSFDLDMRLPGDAPLKLRAARAGDGLQVDAILDAMPLPQLNPYLTQLAGYSIASGAASLTSSGWIGPTWYQTWNDISLDGFDLAGSAGDTLFADQFGVPLSLAIGLLRDPTGGISLGIPVMGDRERGARVELGPIVGQAVVKALLGALTSPLKLIGAVAFSGDRIAAIKPSPIPFDAGSTRIGDDGWWRIGELANALASFPGLRVTLRGRTGEVDIRGLQDAAVLADLTREQGILGSIGTLASRGDRNAVREYLEARAEGKPAELEESRRPALESWAAEKQVTDEDLRRLASERAEHLRDVLANDYGVGPEQVGLGEASVSRAAGTPEVVVAVGGS